MAGTSKRICEAAVFSVNLSCRRADDLRSPLAKAALGFCLFFVFAMMPLRANAQLHTTQTAPIRACYVLPTGGEDDYVSVCRRAGYWRLHSSSRTPIKNITSQDMLSEPGIYELARKNSTDAKLKVAVAWLISDVNANRLRAMKSLTDMSLSGNKFATHNIGTYYFELGSDKTYQISIKYYLESAEQGFVESLNMAGFMHIRGLGVDRNFAAARSYFSAAAEKGNLSAAQNMGLMYSKSYFGSYDIQKSISWYRRGLKLRPFYSSVRICSVLSDQAESPVGLTPSELIFRRYIWCSIASRLADDTLASGAMLDDEDKQEIWSGQNFARQNIIAIRTKYGSNKNSTVNLKKGDQIIQSCLANGVHDCPY